MVGGGGEGNYDGVFDALRKGFIEEFGEFGAEGASGIIFKIVNERRKKAFTHSEYVGCWEVFAFLAFASGWTLTIWAKIFVLRNDVIFTTIA